MLSKKLLGLFLTSTCFTLSSCNTKTHKSVGVIQTSDHKALDETRSGVVDELKAQGYIPGKNLVFKWESAQGNPSTATQIAQKFIGNKYDVLVTIGTLASQATLQAVKETKIPIVYASVTDPKGAKLEGNITGVSNFIEPDIQFKAFKEILPNIKVIGVIYSPGEANSVSLNQKMEAVSSKFGIRLIFSPASKTSDVLGATVNLIGKVNALFVNNDNVALAAFDGIIKVGSEHKVPVFVSDTDMVEKGALAAIGPSQHRVGLKTGKMVASLLKENAPDASKIQNETIDQHLFFLNIKVANALGIKLSDSVVKLASKVFE